METLVIGSTGWIGKNLVNFYPVLSSAGVSSKLSAHDFKEWLNRQNHECFINCIGKFSGSENEMEWANVGIVELILKRARLIGSKVITLGSAAEYGNSNHELLHEDDKPNPISIYGKQKLIATDIINDHVAAGVSAVSARLFNVIGPRQPVTTAIGQIINRLKTLDSHTKFNLDDFDIHRDYITLEFVAQAIAQLAELNFNGAINIGSGRAIKLFDLVSEIAKIKQIEIIPAKLNLNRVRSAVADTCRLSSLGIMAPQLDLGDLSLLWRNDFKVS